MKKAIAIMMLGAALSVPALAQEQTFQEQTFEAAAAPLLDISQCDKQYLARIGKVEAQVIDGQHFVLVHPAPSMTAEGEGAEVHEPFGVGPLKTPATTAQLNSLRRTLICNEPF